MPRTSVPERQYNVGQYDATLSVGASSTGAEIRFTRTASIQAYPLREVLATCRVLLSNDQAQWQEIRSFTLEGGVILGKDGVTPMTESMVRFTWPGEYVDGVRIAQKKNHVRIEANVLQGFRTAITMTSLGEPV